MAGEVLLDRGHGRVPVVTQFLEQQLFVIGIREAVVVRIKTGKRIGPPILVGCTEITAHQAAAVKLVQGEFVNVEPQRQPDGREDPNVPLSRSIRDTHKAFNRKVREESAKDAKKIVP